MPKALSEAATILFEVMYALTGLVLDSSWSNGERHSVLRERGVSPSGGYRLNCLHLTMVEGCPDRCRPLFARAGLAGLGL
jgi:hypothetical protein